MTHSLNQKQIILSFFLVMFVSMAFGQEIRYFSRSFQTRISTKTPHERHYFPENGKVRTEDYENGVVIKKSVVVGTDSLDQVDAYLWYLRNPIDFYLKPYFTQLSSTITALTKAGKLAYHAITHGNSIRFGQVWSNGEPILVNGNGLEENWSSDKTEVSQTVYQDSVIVSSYVIRPQQKDTLFIKVDQPAIPKNGLSDFRTVLAQTIEYPKEAIAGDREGIVYIQFTIDQNGHLRDFKTIHQEGHDFDKGAVKKMERYPAWAPAIVKGRKVKTRYVVPIKFQLVD